MSSSESESEDSDFVTIDALSKEDLTAIVANPRYKMLLTELLNISDLSANPEDRTSGGTTPDLGTGNGANPATRDEDSPNLNREGDDEPPAKRRKEGGDDGPSTSGLFDPVMAGTEEDEYQFTPPKVIADYLEKHFRRSLTKRERKAMLKADPKPGTPVTSPPNVDEYLGVFWKGKLNLSQDGEWKQVQNALLCSTGPLCGLWSQILEQGLDSDDRPIPASAVLDVIQRTLVFLGNANHLLSEKRRLGLLKSIDPNLAKYAKGEFPEAGKDLFGNKFAKEIVGHVEADTAICKASAIVNKGLRSNPSKGKSPLSSKPDFSMGPDRGPWHRFRQNQFQPMEQVKHLPRTRKRQVQPSTKQRLQPAGPKPQRSGPACQAEVTPVTQLHAHTNTYIAGSIRNYLSQWKDLTQDQWIHQVVEGYRIDFLTTPPVGTSCPVYEIDQTRLEALDQEILDLLKKGAVERIPLGNLGFTSPMFVVPKKGGKWRPIINLKSLNQFVEKPHFKMEDIRSLRDILQEGDQMAKLDLKDAYFSVPVAEDHRKFLQFQWRDQLLQFTCLPFGLSSAPYVFTKLLRPVLTSLRDKGVRCLIYLDDMLILGRTAEELKQNFTLAKFLLTSLGFLVNEDKSVSGPTQELEFLGFIINSKSLTLTVVNEKARSLTLQCKTLMESSQITIRQLARIIGIMTSMTPAVLPAPLHYQALEKHSVEPPPLILCTDYPDSGSKTGSVLVEDVSETVENSEHIAEETSPDTGVRCFRSRLGSRMSQQSNFNRGCMEYTRDNPPHQLQGTLGSVVGASVLCFKPPGCTYTSTDRQHSGSSLCEQDGWSTFQGPVSTSTTTVGLVPVQESHDFRGTPTRFLESTGR